MARRERGDTIVEAVIAFAIFSAVAVGAMVIMNRGVAIAQRSLEATLVREQIDAQADMLRYLRDNDQAAWGALATDANVSTNPQPISPNAITCTKPTASSRAFFVSGRVNGLPKVNTISSGGGNYVDPATYAQVQHGANPKSSNIWIEMTKSENSTSVKAYDFRIHACWNSAGGDNPVTLGTIVRLYAK